MSSIPREKSFDSTWAMLSEGYNFISHRCERYGSDVFETRLMFTPAFCMRGEEAARFFYHPGRFTRRKAVPLTMMKLLQDVGSVQWLDNGPHRCRKQMFMSLMEPDAIRRLSAIFSDQWRAAISRWRAAETVSLDWEAAKVLFRTVTEWAGTPVSEQETDKRARDLALMFDRAGTVGPRNWGALMRRRRAERWAGDMIERVRSGSLQPPAGSAAYAIATHLDLDGDPLDRSEAAVELLNVLRPTVAVARYITFIALALHQWPEWRERLQRADDTEVENFVHEVRRYFPFFPFLGGRARERFEWRDRTFSEGAWFVLDLYGTNHDPRIWDNPSSFQPDRFYRWNGSAYNFIPQGGGDFIQDHRCPGEWATIALMKTAARQLAEMTYEVPEQDLRIDLSRMPAVPKSRFIMRNIEERKRPDMSFD